MEIRIHSGWESEVTVGGIDLALAATVLVVTPNP